MIDPVTFLRERAVPDSPSQAAWNQRTTRLFYSIANARCGTNASYSVEQLVALKQAGMGLGEIRKQALGTAANGCSLGKLKQAEMEAADQHIDAAQQEQQRQQKQRQEKAKKEQERREKHA